MALFLAERIQRRRGAHTIALFDPKRTYHAIKHTSNLDELEELLVTQTSPVAYQPFASVSEKDSADEVSEEFDRFFDALGIEYHLGVRERPSRPDMAPVVLVVDEAWFLQGGARANTKLERLVRLADSRNFYLLQASHRPKDFSTRIRAQVDELYLFRQWLEEDIEIIREWCGEEVSELVRMLPPHHVIRYEISTGTHELWAKPLGWYRPIAEKSNDDGNQYTEGREARVASRVG